jgi:hypothetical protein
MTRIRTLLLPALCALALPAFAAVSVSSPGNGASLTSPFRLDAYSSSCSNEPTSTMGYSLDSSTDTTIVNGTSISASVPAPTGTHTVHVKAWGNKGASCVTDVTVNITGTSSTTTSTTSSGSADGITVSSPGMGATVGSPFTLSASASDCSGQAVSAMGYSLDGSSNTTVVKSTSIGASVSAAAGSHTLHVKSWGDGGAGCVANVSITVTSGTTTIAAATTSSGGVSVSSPGNGATVSSPFDVTGSASTCSGQPVASMAYSLDSGGNADVVSGTSINASASASGGAHTVHVKAWGNHGASCVANIAINVSSGGSSSGSSGGGPNIPSYATSVSSLEVLGSWKEQSDSGASGHASGTMSLTGSPALSGNSRRFYTSYTDGGNERYWVSFGDDTSAQNFVYDGWVYLNSSAGDIANLEMDLNQVMPNGQTVIYGFQCDGYAGVWDFTKNSGSASSYNDSWVRSSATCNVRNWARNMWHHVQISYSRNSSGYVTYHTVWLDGVAQSINATVYSAFALGWGPSLVTNFQVDGLGTSGSNTVYLDKLTVYRW